MCSRTNKFKAEDNENAEIGVPLHASDSLMINLHSVKILIFSIFVTFTSACNLKFPINNTEIKIAYLETDKNFIETLLTDFSKKTHIKIKSQIIQEKPTLKDLKNSFDIFIGDLDDNLEPGKNKILIAKSPIVAITHRDQPLNEISSSILKQRFPEYFKSDESISAYAFLHKKDSESIKQIKEKKKEIALVNWSAYDNAVKILNIDETPINIKSIKLSYYPLNRNIYLYRLNYSSNKKLNLSINKFFKYIYSDSAQNLISELKLSPLSKAELDASKQYQESLKIGLALPFSSDDLDLAESVLESVKLARDDFHFMNIDLIICDDQAKTAEALDCAKLFINKKVKAVIGHFNSDTSIATSKLYAQNKIIQISPCSTHPWLTYQDGVQGNVFRAISIDIIQAQTIASLVHKLNTDLSLKKILLIDNNTLFGSNLSALIKTEISKGAGNFSFKEQSLIKKNFNSSIIPKDFQPGIVIFVGGYIDAAKILSDTYFKKNKQTIFIGSDGTYSETLLKLAHNKSNGAYIIGANIDPESNEFQKYQTKLKEKYKSEVSADGIYGYDAASILFSAILAYERGEYPSISEALQKMKFNSLGREIYFDDHGDPVNSTYAVYRIENSDFHKINL